MSRRCGNTSGCYLAFQNISGFLYGHGKSDSEDRPNARPSRLDVYLLWAESNSSGKAVIEDRPDEANFRPDTNLLESKFELK
jgi:hypothetical protein